ncbi:GNAT family N-acetyltransferase [Aureimonas leprariae]|uniref:GNAT family N-acetyltransferase n=1 Tax=Plantimonas leprariae TaxID=2615207 RepID=A0A7V7PS61_9HYPH|nr:GNAT family N-acetyltransferase [Aureimonas leprariae]KAB0681833.1 GNAT family N-acetyltransferase [Aureimonas leprariae]
MRIAVEAPLQDEVRALVAALNAHLRPLSPPEFQFQLTAEQMAGGDTTVFIVRDETSRPVGMGALKAHDASTGEVKRMYAAPEVRGKGVGWLVLQAIEAKARALGLARLVLETGATPGFEPAWALYQRSGFAVCGAVLDYPDSGYSRFYEKTLTP